MYNHYVETNLSQIYDNQTKLHRLFVYFHDALRLSVCEIVMCVADSFQCILVNLTVMCTLCFSYPSMHVYIMF